MAPRLLTYADAAKALAVSIDTVQRLCQQGRLRRVRIGRAIRVTSDSIEKLIRDAEGRVNPSAKASPMQAER